MFPKVQGCWLRPRPGWPRRKESRLDRRPYAFAALRIRQAGSIAGVRMSSTIIPQHAEVRVASAVKDLLNRSLSFAKTPGVLSFTPLTMVQALCVSC